MSEKRVCSRCGEKSRVEAVFCGSCGAEFKVSFDERFEEGRNRFFVKVKEFWSKQPVTVKRLAYALAMIVIGSQGPWGLLGDMGGYVSAGLILGGIFILVYKMLGVGKRKASKGE